MGIAVVANQVQIAANSMGCLTLKPPFLYLGVKVGGMMSRINSWDDIVNKVKARLSKWKMKTLLIGGRLTLLKSVLGSMPIYHLSMYKVPAKVLHTMESIRSHFFNDVETNEKKMVWASWSSVLASKNNGGLGISSFYALNRALMFKWVWRFRTQGSSLWARVIAAIHGDLGHLHILPTSSYSSTWMDIVRETFSLKQQGIDLITYISKKVGNGENSLFWDDIWMGDTILKEQYPRVYALETCKSILIAEKLAHSNIEVSLRRPPRAGAELYQTNELSSMLASIQLPMIQDRWVWSLDGT
ncbi:hypothetical protein Tco_1115123 [Tanacetum coccineum]